MHPRPAITIYSLLLFSALACKVEVSNPAPTSFTNMEVPDEFAEYWFTGEGEISSYTLHINRYGEKRRGTAVNVFVTEDFSASQQVKLDNPSEAGEDKVSVLKLNQLYKFPTGVYDYSMMNSVFTPIEILQYPHSLKVTCSSQDWCGQTFTQMNHTGSAYQLQQFSYFQREGDIDVKVKPEMLEDELWTRLRIDPNTVPEGEVLLWPGNFFLRLSHEEPKPRAARIQFESSEATSQCIVEYLHLDRTIRIHFESSFPHRILSWSVEKGGNEMVTARLVTTIKTPYWERNANSFEFLRDSLGLKM